MRTKIDRRNFENKELNKRIKICKEVHCYSNEDLDYIKRKRDIPHSLGSNYWNAYETKSMKNKQYRLKLRNKLKQEIFENERI